MENLQFLLKQHVGAPCRPVVKEGEKVQKGTLLAKPQGLGANLFSSVYGVVQEVRDDRIIVCPDEVQKEEFLTLDPGSPLEMVKEAGIVGMGGAGFPTGVKLDVDLHGGTLLVNAVECEPGLGHNIRQIEEKADMTIEGARLCMEMTHASRVIFAIKEKNKQAVERLRSALEKEERMYIHLLPDIYPMGEERAIVRECLGKLLDPVQLPSAADAVVINVETVLRVFEAVKLKKPCFSKNMTVTGKLKGEEGPRIYMDVPIGISVKELIEQAGGIDGEYGEVIMGGPFTGKAVSLTEPVTKTTGGIIVTIDLPDLHGAPVGLLVCACGGSEERMRDICGKMHGTPVSVARCKQAIEMKNGALKCENPGNCPGQAAKCLQFKKDGAEYIIIGNCSDCSNTVMGSAPKMKLKVFHQTDHVMRTIHHPLYRRLKVSKQVEQLPNGK